MKMNKLIILIASFAILLSLFSIVEAGQPSIEVKRVDDFTFEIIVENNFELVPMNEEERNEKGIPLDLTHVQMGNLNDTGSNAEDGYFHNNDYASQGIVGDFFRINKTSPYPLEGRAICVKATAKNSTYIVNNKVENTVTTPVIAKLDYHEAEFIEGGKKVKFTLTFFDFVSSGPLGTGYIFDRIDTLECSYGYVQFNTASNKWEINTNAEHSTITFDDNESGQQEIVQAGEKYKNVPILKPETTRSIRTSEIYDGIYFAFKVEQDGVYEVDFSIVNPGTGERERGFELYRVNNQTEIPHYSLAVPVYKVNSEEYQYYPIPADATVPKTAILFSESTHPESGEIIYLIMPINREYFDTILNLDEANAIATVTLKTIESQGPFYENGNEIPVNPDGYWPLNQPEAEVVFVAPPEEPKEASLIERLVTLFLVTLGDGAMWLIGLVAGDNVSLDTIFFNGYANIRLGFFNDQRNNSDMMNPLLESTGILSNAGDPGTLNAFFSNFRLIAIVAYTGMLLYVGIQILLKSTGRAKAKYKDFIMYWIMGVAILFVFPYVIKYTISINNALVSFVQTVKIQAVNIDEPEIPVYPGSMNFPIEFGGKATEAQTDYMGYMRKQAMDTGRAAYALCWLILIKELVGFLIIYYKRLLITAFLIIIFPLVTISYAFDRLKDGKSQAFNNWLKEFILNVFLQSFHAVNYTVIMSIISAVGKVGVGSSSTNYVLMLVGITYIAKGEDILRKIFGQDKSVGTVDSAAKTVAKAAVALRVAGKVKSTVKKKKETLSKLNDRRLQVSNMYLKHQEARLNEKYAALGNSQNRNHSEDGTVTEDISADIAGNLSVARDENATPEEIKNAIRKLSAYNKDKHARSELQAQLEESGDAEEINGLFKDQDAIDGIARNVNVKNNFEVLIRRKKGKNREKLLESYGYTSDKLNAYVRNRKEVEKKYSALEGLRKNRVSAEQKAIATYSLKGLKNVYSQKKAAEAQGKDPEQYSYQDARMDMKGKEAGKSKSTIKGKKKLSSSGKTYRRAPARDEVVGRRRSQGDRTIGKQTAANLKQPKPKNETRNIYNSAMATRMQSGGKADDVITTKKGETRTVANVYEQLARQTNDANTTDSTTEYIKSRFQMEDTIAETGMERDAALNKMRSRLVNDNEKAEQRFNSVAARVEYAQREFTTAEARKSDPATRVAYTAEKRTEYINVATAFETLTDEGGTLTERIDAASVLEKVVASDDVGIRAILRDTYDKQSIGELRTILQVEKIASEAQAANTHTEYIKSRFQMEELITKQGMSRNEDIIKLRAGLDVDVESEQRFNSVAARVEYAQREFITNELRKSDSGARSEYTTEKREEYIKVATAVETLTTATGTLTEQIEAAKVLEQIATSDDVGIKAILKDRINPESIGEIKTFLNVEAINNYNELSGSALQKQAIIDEAVRDVRLHKNSSGVYQEILSELDFNPDRLKVGDVPIRTDSNRPESREVYVPSGETPEMAAIRRALEQNSEEMETFPIYRVGNSYDTEKEGRKLTKKVVKLSADMLKEAATDVGGIVGGTLGLSAELAIDKKYSAEEMATSTLFGGNVGSGIVKGAANVITKANKARKKIIKGLEDYDTSNSPIVRFDDQGRVIRNDNEQS